MSIKVRAKILVVHLLPTLLIYTRLKCYCLRTTSKLKTNVQLEPITAHGFLNAMRCCKLFLSTQTFVCCFFLRSKLFFHALMFLSVYLKSDLSRKRPLHCSGVFIEETSLVLFVFLSENIIFFSLKKLLFPIQWGIKTTRST